MVKNIKEIEPGRYRETFGRYYEDFNIGDIYEHRPEEQLLNQTILGSLYLQ